MRRKQTTKLRLVKVGNYKTLFGYKVGDIITYEAKRKGEVLFAGGLLNLTICNYFESIHMINDQDDMMLLGEKIVININEGYNKTYIKMYNVTQQQTCWIFLSFFKRSFVVKK